MKKYFRAFAVLSATALLSIGSVRADSGQDITREWRTSVDYRNGSPDFKVISKPTRVKDDGGAIEIGKRSDRYTIRYKNGYDIRLQNSGGSDFKFDVRGKPSSGFYGR